LIPPGIERILIVTGRAIEARTSALETVLGGVKDLDLTVFEENQIYMVRISIYSSSLRFLCPMRFFALAISFLGTRILISPMPSAVNGSTD
jgi:hypothetical protein